MNKEFERYLIIFLLLMLIGLSGCVKKEVTTSNNPKLPDTVLEPKEETHTITDSIGKMQGVANALVCMFSPDTCETKKQEMDMDR